MRSQERSGARVLAAMAGLGLMALAGLFLVDGVSAAGPKTDAALVVDPPSPSSDQPGGIASRLAPVLSYSNSGGTVLNRPGAGFRIADDLELVATCGCDLTSYSVSVGGIGDGTGTFDVIVSLFDGCPGETGLLIPGTERLFNNIPNDTEATQLNIDLSASPITVPGIIWIRVQFSSNLAGWWTGSQAETGVTRDKYDHPFTGCNSGLGAAIYAGFDAEAFCEEFSSAPGAPLAPVPANGAVDVVPNVMLTWSGNSARGDRSDPAGVEDNPTYNNTYEALGIVPQSEVIMPSDSLAAVRAAADAGEIPDPTLRRLPQFAPRTPRARSASNMVSTVTRDDLTLFEDTDGLLDTPFSDGQLFNLMADASNEVLAQHGDNFDFVAFFLNFAADHQIGAAFYLGLEGHESGIGTGTFNQRPGFGVGGVNIEGWVMMWNQSSWSPGGGSTRLVLGQEFEHRFGMFLNSLPGGRPLQGDGGPCGRGAHWNFRVDGQGSGMEIAEWIGSSPANRQGGSLNFNTDIGVPGVFSHPDLYLMGYISPAELDSFPSELRYMDNNPSCNSSYNGTISTWTSADIEATNGVRNPNSQDAQKHFRTAWVMVHRAGSPPSNAQMDRVASMLNDWSDVYEFSTLGRGTMDNSTVNFVPACTTLYDVRFGTVNPPTTLICEDIPDKMCDPGLLSCNNTYFWQVTSKLASETTEGPVWSFSAPTGTEDCDSNGVVDVCDLALGNAQDCQPDSIPDICQIPPLGPPDADCNFNAVPDVCDVAGGAADCQSDGIPDICQVPPLDPTGADCNTNDVPDECDLTSGVLHDTNGNSIPDECEVSPALEAPAPHDIRKNRFVSFDPNPANLGPAKFRLDLLDLACGVTGQQCNSDGDCKACVGGATGAPCTSDSDCSGGSCEVSGESCEQQSPPVVLGWVGTPTDAGNDAPAGTKTAEVVKVEPAARVWTESVVHISDCEIAPVHDYAISASSDGVSFAEPLIVSTIAQPQGKFWADIVGTFDGVLWSAPNLLVGVDDVNAMIKFLSLKPAPHITRVDLIGSAPTYTNFIINATDLTMVLQGFVGETTYPPVPYVVEGYPADGDVTLCP